MTPKPETEEYNVRNFVYTRRRPFHPRRIFGLLYDKFILQLEHPEEEDDDEDDEDDEEDESEDEEMTTEDSQESLSSSNRSSPFRSASDGSTAVTVPSPAGSSNGKEADDDAIMADDLIPPPNPTILSNKRASPLFARLFRSKGEFYLATRPHRAGEWSQAGAMLTMTGGRPWFCTLPPEEYMTGSLEIDALVQHDMKSGGEWGDRRQELVFIGEKLDIKELEKVLDECLLTDDEFASWEEVMRDDVSQEEKLDRLADLFDDGFPDWPEDDDHEGHDHGPGEHGTARGVARA